MLLFLENGSTVNSSFSLKSQIKSVHTVHPMCPTNQNENPTPALDSRLVCVSKNDSLQVSS